MFGRTHLAITLFAVFLFLAKVDYKISFVVVAVIATYIPDIDTPFSFFGKFKFNRIVQFFSKHRGMMHSLNLCIVLSLAIALVFPKFALPFFLAYSLHIFADAFTFEGLAPFWPYRRNTSGIIRTGGIAEKGIFSFFVLADLWLLIFFVL